MLKYFLYLGRWQLSTPILAIVPWVLALVFGISNYWLAAIITNLIGGACFFFIDRLIFRSHSKVPLWEIKENVMCFDCGQLGIGYRIVEWKGYNRRTNKDIQFRCSTCKDIKKAKIEVNINK